MNGIFNDTRFALRQLAAKRFVAAATVVGIIALTGWSLPTFASPSEENAEYLFTAVTAGRVDIVRALVGAGANVNVCVHGDGTPLIVASQLGNLKMVKTLATLGANVNMPCLGDGNPLIAASRYGKLDVVKWLLAHGAKVDAAVPGDETALITVVRNNQLSAVKYLVLHGANVNLGVMTASGQWRTPLNQASDSSIRKFLLSHGAKNPPPTPPSSLREQGEGLNARIHA